MMLSPYLKASQDLGPLSFNFNVNHGGKCHAVKAIAYKPQGL